MKAKRALMLCLICATALAGPSRPVQSSTFVVQAPCGPAQDPFAQQGQWFLDMAGSTHVNVREYHDEDSAMSISGVVQSITFSTPGNPHSNITAFEILATVFNTLPSVNQYAAASNSHNEVQSIVTKGGSTMADVRITAEFALANAGVIPSGTPPYWADPLSQGQYHIVAVNQDEHAWYCWAPGQTNPQFQPAGAYQVPAWNLTPSTIPPGGTATVLMKFVVTGSGIPYGGGLGDYRHGVLRYSKDHSADVLYNRCQSLKISHWLDTIVIDNGVTMTTPPTPTQYWEGDEIIYVHASDASVFYNDIEDEPEDPHKMHYPQYPDPNGWDVRACYGGPPDQGGDGKRKVLADDFLCTSNGPITHITFWGSWSNDFYEAEEFQGIQNIHLSMHKDIPDPDGQGPGYSMPQLPSEWERDIDPNNPLPGWSVEIRPEQSSLQGWYDPNTGTVMEENHWQYFRYDIWIPTEEAFIQEEGSIYWLDISVDTVVGMWGWKSTTNHWNDDAVWADLPVDDLSQWNELYEPPDFERSLDLAFIIDGEPPIQEELDYGDLPDNFNTTIANSGASHGIAANVYLGFQLDAEPDGQPSTNADGDDLAGPSSDDEDGVAFNSLFIPGLQAKTTLNITTPAAGGWLDIWIDADNSGNWTPGDNVFSGPVNSGPSVILFQVPSSTLPGANVMRVRLSTATGPLQPTGYLLNGEVEDYIIQIDELDWGDTPDDQTAYLYPTRRANNGARHRIAAGINYGLRLGWLLDAETNGQVSPQADGDDLTGTAPDDEDGVVFNNTALIPGTYAQVSVYAGVNTNSVSGYAYLQGWVDFNNDGSWGTGERIFTDHPVTFMGVANTNNLTFLVPTNAVAGSTYARFRLSSSSGLGQAGLAQDGEVEDYLINIKEARDIDWGDAFDTLQGMIYPTLMIHTGAHHVVSRSMFMGAGVDGEPDGQPNMAATGDDIDLVFPPPNDDEDGVFFTTALQPGGYAGVDVMASQPGMLDAWADFNGDGDWDDAGERIFTSEALSMGINSLLFAVPTSATQNAPVVTRFRYTSGGVATYKGLAMDGEVEDHLTPDVMPIEQGNDFGDADQPYPTLFPAGARHTITPGIMLGATIDAEGDGLPHPQAMGDDITGIDDEDGVSFTSDIIAGNNTTLDVVAGTLGGKLDAWVDFTSDGDWMDTGEQIFANKTLVPGLNNLNFTVPGLPAQALGASVARFRISSSGGLGPAGVAANGEVEDYMVDLFQPAPTNLVITNLTFNASYTVSTNEWTVQSGIIYQLESKTNLLTNPWIPAGASVIGPLNSQTDTMSTDTNKFYRVTAPWSK